MAERAYIAIDLKSFYASVECRERQLNPLTTHLVVADESRTEKTICLAVSPSLKEYGIPGRARLFEVNEQVRLINARRQWQAPGKRLAGASWDKTELAKNPALALDFIIARPRMACYMAYSTRIYQIYTRFVSPEDIHVYSIDEVFMDATPYLATYRTTPRALAEKMIRAVLEETGITATAGIGTNLYLAKIAMDIVAKHMPPDAQGVRIAELDEAAYRRQLWSHRPLTDFWRIGRGYARKLEANGLYTMGDIAMCSLGGKYHPFGEDRLYKLFGINAELLIDHAWGWESCTIPDIKAFQPENNSLSSGQVLQQPYDFDKARLVVREMTDALALDLVAHHLVTDQMVLTIGYDTSCLTDPARREQYTGPIEEDYYGRKVPKAAHGSIRLPRQTASARLMIQAVMELYDQIVHPDLLVRRMYVVANRVLDESRVPRGTPEQLNMFLDYEQEQKRREQENRALDREKRRQLAVLGIREKFGKNAIFRGMDLEEGATARERNAQIGGHRA